MNSFPTFKPMLIEDPRRAALLALVAPHERSATCNRFLEPIRAPGLSPEQLVRSVLELNARRGNPTADLILEHPAEALAFAAWTIEWEALPMEDRKKQRASGRGARAIAERAT